MSAENQKALETELRDTIAMLQAKADEFGSWKDADGLTRESFTKMNDRIDTLQDQLAEVTKAALRTVNGADEKTVIETKDELARQAIVKYIRKGDARLSAAERDELEVIQKALSVDSDPDGGFVVTPAQSRRIVEVVYETSYMRQVATVETIGTDALEGLFDGDEAAAAWVSERGARAETNTPQLGQWRIPTHEMFANPRATQKFLDDANVNVEAWLMNKVADRFARTENLAFVRGTGSGQPRGFVTYADGTVRGTVEQIPSLNALFITSEAIVNIVYALKRAYRPGSVFVMNRATVGHIRTLREMTGGAGTGQFMWQPGFGGEPAMLMGHPIIEFEDMDDVGTAANLPVGFGNFGAAYTIVDRAGVRVLRDPFSAKPHVEFYTTRRVGGDVINFEAVKLMDIAAA